MPTLFEHAGGEDRHWRITEVERQRFVDLHMPIS